MSNDNQPKPALCSVVAYGIKAVAHAMKTRLPPNAYGVDVDAAMIAQSIARQLLVAQYKAALQSDDDAQ